MKSPSAAGIATAVLSIAVGLAACGARKPEAHIEEARVALKNQDTDTALVVLKSVLQEDPSSGGARLLMANALMTKEDWAGAAAELEKAVQLGVPARDLVTPKARVLLAQGKARLLIEDFGQEKLSDPSAQADLQAVLAAAHLQVGERERAEQALDGALRVNPKHLDAKLLRAKIFASQGRVADLAVLLDALVHEHPESAEAHMLRYRFRAEAGAPAEERLSILKAALRAEPRHNSANAALVEFYIRENQLQSARSQLTEFARKHPRDLRVRLLDASLTLREGKPHAALDMARELMKLAPRHPAAATIAGVIAYRTGDLLQAESSLAKVLSMQPDNTAIRVLLAQSQLGQGDADRALSTVRARLGSSEPQAELLAVAGAAHMMRGEHSKAEEALNASMREGNRLKSVRMSVAMLKLEGSRTNEGLAELNQLVAEESDGHTAQLALINAHQRAGRFDEAVRAIETLSTKRAHDPLGPFLQGQMKLGRNQLEPAREAFSEALRRDPRHFPSISALNALDLRLSKGTADSYKRLQKILDIHPRHVKARLAFIRLESLEKRDAAHTRELYAALLKDAPTDVEAHLAQVRFHLDVGDIKSALAAAQAADAALPGEPSILAALGRAYILTGDLNQALSTYGQWASAQPRAIPPLLRIAELQLQRKDFGAVSVALARALSIQPNNMEAQQAQVSLELTRGRFDAALAVARRIQQWPANRVVGVVLEGDVNAAQRQWAAALRAYLRAQSMDDRSSAIAIKVHQIHTMMGNKVEAERHTSRWLSQNPNSMEYLLYAGNAAVVAGDLPKAEMHWERAHAIAPDQALVANNLAWLRVELKRDNALEMAQLANRLQPGNTKILDTLASAQALTGDLNAGVITQREALDLAPHDHALRLHLVEMLLLAKQPAEAKGVAARLSSEKLTDRDREKLRQIQGRAP